MSPDDKELFKDAMEDVVPLKNRASTLWLKSPARQAPQHSVAEPLPQNPLISGLLDIIPVTTPLEYKAQGIQQGVLDKLRCGKYRPDASLNLLRQPTESCRQILYRFMLEAMLENCRNLLIIHGKGSKDTAHANIVRSYLFRWLQQFEEVQAFCIARPQHGGSGACYVGLRKSEQARAENRERHAKRSR
ncbi:MULTISPECIES: DNA endonuclease SmrA [Erwinia]|uniref:DNA endonuclease SmrA n=2 Tax=Erwinia TaxID=551 RepID=A0A014NSV4_9GAMM|nr:DNA endonuclease SmrA [Erwinia mallotivora]EXU76945.1 DNA endonuclease SmrA [Erwinia mallotivora]